MAARDRHIVRQAEVEDLDHAVGGEEDVFWLEVAVRKAAGVGRRKALGEVHGDLDGLGSVERVLR